jgi:ribonucleotide reductase alpha subunit
MGTNRGLPVSCSGAYIQDSIDSFYSVRHETALLTKHGFGTSAYLGDIRPRGTPISVGGKASGVVPLFKGFVQDMRDVAQGTARRGAWAGYLPIDHGDFDELIDFIHSESDDANVGWIITDAFIAKLNNGDTDSVRRYQKAMKIKMVTGKGYFLFIDKANRHRPECYKKHDLTIKNSNLCLVGDSIIIIKESEISNEIYIRLDEFVDKYQFGYYTNPLVKSYKDNKIVWSVITDAGKTADVEELYEIESPNGKIIRCTANHKIFTTNRGYVEAKNLVETDTVLEG